MKEEVITCDICETKIENSNRRILIVKQKYIGAKSTFRDWIRKGISGDPAHICSECIEVIKTLRKGEQP